jgi:6,7-dimethyl-8-ribityllumazine synthase
VTTIETQRTGNGRRVAAVVSRFNHPVSSRLLDGCTARLAEQGCTDVDVLWVPGAFELPLAAQAAAETGRYDAIVVLGAVIRGGTPHFDYVCRAVTDGVRSVILATRVPIAFGVLTTDTPAQALERAARAGEPGENKGADAADVALEMAGLLDALGQERAS